MIDNWEQRTREALTWAIGETPIRLPEALLGASGWAADDQGRSLYANTPEGAFRFHVELEHRGSRRTRITVMTMNTRGGTRVDWQAPIPPRS